MFALQISHNFGVARAEMKTLIKKFHDDKLQKQPNTIGTMRTEPTKSEEDIIQAEPTRCEETNNVGTAYGSGIHSNGNERIGNEQVKYVALLRARPVCRTFRHRRLVGDLTSGSV